MKIGILGSGSWGTALGQVLCDNGHDVLIYGNVRAQIDDINLRHKNTQFFADAPVTPLLHATDRLTDLASYGDLFVIAVPTQAVPSVMQLVLPYIRPDTVIVNASKGFERETNRRISDAVRSALGDTPYGGFASIIGPSHAEEVILRKLTSVCAVSLYEAVAKQVQTLFSNAYLRVYVSTDEIGAEYGVAIKNVSAIASGILEGQGYGDNAKAALITRGLCEMVRYGVYKGGRRETFFGLTGVGDLIVTCFSPHSRNYRAGLSVGRANSSAVLKENTHTVEGINSCKSVHEDAASNGIEMPIVDSVYRILFEDTEPSQMIREIMGRPLKAE